MGTEVLWQGHEADSYILGPGATLEATTARDPANERTAMQISANNSQASFVQSSPDWLARNEIWHTFRRLDGRQNVGDGMSIWAAHNAAGVAQARIIRRVSDSMLVFQVWNGAVYAELGAFAELPSGTYRFDVHFRGGADGRAEVYYGAPGAQTKVIDATGDYSAATNIVRIYHDGPNNNIDSSFVGAAIVQTTPTLSSTAECKPPTSNGVDVGGTGTWADVDEVIYSDSDTVTLNTVGQRQSFKAAARTQTQEVVTGVTASCRAWYEAGGPSQLRAYLTIGGVRYYGKTFNLDLVAKAYQHTWLLNPATGAPFSAAQAAAATLEWGWEAV